VGGGGQKQTTVKAEDSQLAARPDWVGEWPAEVVVEVEVVVALVVEVTRVVEVLDVVVLVVVGAAVTVPSTQYDWPATSVGQATPGFRASKLARVRPQAVATVVQVSPEAAATL
jgi:hypothetical protein